MRSPTHRCSLRPAGTSPCRIASSERCRIGVLAAGDGPARARRLETSERALAFEPLSVDGRFAGAWAALRLALHDEGRRMPLSDSWIPATAIAHRIPVVSQDADYEDVPGLEVIRV